MLEKNLSDDVPNIQFIVPNIQLVTNNCNLANSKNDNSSFTSCFSKDLEQIISIETLVNQGQKFVNMLYTFRSVSRTIPMTVIILINCILLNIIFK